MGYPNTNLIQSLGTQEMVDNGSTPGIKLSNLALRGLYLLFSTKPDSGNTAQTVSAICNTVKRIRVNIDGADDYNLSGQSLHVMNRWFMKGETLPEVAQTSGGERVVGLYLPFELVGGIKSQDTLLDLRPRANGSLPNAYVQFDTALTASHSGTIRVYEHYYNLGDKARPSAFRKQIIQKSTQIATAGDSFIIPLDYGAPMDDIARIFAWIESSSGGIEQAPVFRQAKLTASEGTQYDVFDLTMASSDGYSGMNWIFNRLLDISDNFEAVVCMNFLADNSLGQAAKLSGVLDASLMSNLTLSGNAGKAGSLNLVLERVNVRKEPGADPYAGM